MNQQQISLVNNDDMKLEDVKSPYRDIFICVKSNLPLETSQLGQTVCSLASDQNNCSTCMNHIEKCTLNVHTGRFGAS